MIVAIQQSVNQNNIPPEKLQLLPNSPADYLAGLGFLLRHLKIRFAALLNKYRY